MPSPETTFWFMPSLVATLLQAEQEKGCPLTEAEVLQIRDHAPVVAVRPSDIPALEEKRGYQDLDPETCWQQWQLARKELISSD